MCVCVCVCGCAYVCVRVCMCVCVDMYKWMLCTLYTSLVTAFVKPLQSLWELLATTTCMNRTKLHSTIVLHSLFMCAHLQLACVNCVIHRRRVEQYISNCQPGCLIVV